MSPQMEARGRLSGNVRTTSLRNKYTARAAPFVWNQFGLDTKGSEDAASVLTEARNRQMGAWISSALS